MFTGLGLGCLHRDQKGYIRLHGDMSGDGGPFYQRCLHRDVQGYISLHRSVAGCNRVGLENFNDQRLGLRIYSGIWKGFKSLWFFWDFLQI